MLHSLPMPMLSAARFQEIKAECTKKPNSPVVFLVQPQAWLLLFHLSQGGRHQAVDLLGTLLKLERLQSRKPTHRARTVQTNMDMMACQYINIWSGQGTLSMCSWVPRLKPWTWLQHVPVQPHTCGSSKRPWDLQPAFPVPSVCSGHAGRRC